MEFVRAATDLGDVVRHIERMGAVLIGDEEHTLAIATASDLSAFLWEASRPFILLQDIELAVRHLMRRACTDPQELEQSIAAALPNDGGKEGPTRLEELTFGELLSVLTQGEQFGRVFRRTFGGQRPLILSLLEPVREVRNKVFHFRDEVTVEELEAVVRARLWLQRKVAMAA